MIPRCWTNWLPQSPSWILRRLAPTMAEVSSRALAQLEEWLWLRDYLPALTSAVHYQDLTQVPAVGEVQWQLQLDGLLKPLYATPDLLSRQYLRAIYQARRNYWLAAVDPCLSPTGAGSWTGIGVHAGLLAGGTVLAGVPGLVSYPHEALGRTATTSHLLLASSVLRC